MVNISKITILLFALFVVGCGSNPVKKETEVQQVNKPILYCPAPQNIERPQLATETIKAEDSSGEIAKKYKAAVRQLLDYSKQLESQLNRYDQTNEAYQQLRQEFKEQKRQDGFSSQSNGE